MAKELTLKAQNQLNDADIKVQFILKINNIDYTDYLISWSLDYSKEFGSASATFVLNNDGVFLAKVEIIE
jgi:hypothetical protein